MAGETYSETAARKVHEETGWMIDRNSVTLIGFLHLYNLGEPLDPYPHPDTLQAVVVATASQRAANGWIDSEGYELTSRLVSLNEAQDVVSSDEPLCIVFLQHLLSGRR